MYSHRGSDSDHANWTAVTIGLAAIGATGVFAAALALLASPSDAAKPWLWLMLTIPALALVAGLAGAFAPYLHLPVPRPRAGTRLAWRIGAVVVFTILVIAIITCYLMSRRAIGDEAPSTSFHIDSLYVGPLSASPTDDPSVLITLNLVNGGTNVRAKEGYAMLIGPNHGDDRKVRVSEVRAITPTDEDYFDYPAGQTTHVQFPMTMSERLLHMYLAGDARLYVDLKMYTLSRNGDKLQQDLCVYKTGQSHEVTICPD